jgi:hypothetical protein
MQILHLAFRHHLLLTPPTPVYPRSLRLPSQQMRLFTGVHQLADHPELSRALTMSLHHDASLTLHVADFTFKVWLTSASPICIEGLDDDMSLVMFLFAPSVASCSFCFLTTCENSQCSGPTSPPLSWRRGCASRMTHSRRHPSR